MGPICFFFFVLKFYSVYSDSPLGREVTPSHYEIMWAVEECEFTGGVVINIDVNNETKEFELHAGKNLQIEKDSIKLISSEKLINNLEVEERMVKNGCEQTEDKRLKLKLLEPLDVGYYELYLDFKGSMISDDTYGFFCQRYIENNQTKWLASTSFEPMSARLAFPCFDEPGLKANLTISVAHDKKFTAISNMPLSTSVPSELGENWVVDTFQTTPKMSTYLIGVHVSEYDKIETKFDEKPIRLWADSEGIKYGDFALEMTAKVLAFLENHTGIKDPMPKQDLISIDNYSVSGLEKWGIVSYTKNLILKTEDSSEFETSILIAHELAHSYFGNLVSIDSWGDLWLKEGFASYYSVLPLEKIYPDEVEQHWNQERSSAMRKDSRNSHPLRTSNPLKCFYDAISYEKGSLILRMLNFTLGEEVLRQGINNYLRKNAFALASHESLWKNLQEVLTEAKVPLPEDVNLEQMMDSWINLPGYPVITVNRNKTGEITLTQRSIDGEKSGWFIPLSYKYEGENVTGFSPRIWLDPRQPVLKIKDLDPSKCVMFNLHGITYARVLYDKQNIELMIQNRCGLNIHEKIRVISDMTELARLGLAPIEDSLDTWLLLKDETDFWVHLIKLAFGMLSYLEDTELYAIYKDFLKSILGGVYEESAHKMALACKLGVEECFKTVKEKLEKWFKDPNYKIPKNIRILCAGINGGESNTWNMVSDRLKINDKNEKEDILNLLACVKDEQILLEYFPFILNATSDDDILVNFAELHPDLFLDHSENMTRSIGKNNWQKILQVLAFKVNSQKRLEKFQKLIENSLLPEEKMVSLIVMAKKKVSWMENNKKVETLMESYMRSPF